MADFPAMPFWFDAYMLDCGHLSDAEHGRYLLILKELWTAPNQRIPNDDEWLARRFRRSVQDVQEQIRPLIREFCQNDGNWITQRRVSREFAYVSKSRKLQSARAKSRWAKEKGQCRGNATHCNAPTPTPTPTDSVSSKEEDTAPNGAAVPAEIDIKRAVYEHGKRVLGTKAGGEITKAIAKCGVGATAEMIEATERERAIDPMAFFQGCVRRRSQPGGIPYDPFSL